MKQQRELQLELPVDSAAPGTQHSLQLDAQPLPFRLRLSWRLVHLAPAEIEGVIPRLLAPLKERAGMRDLWDAAPLPA